MHEALFIFIEHRLESMRGFTFHHRRTESRVYIIKMSFLEAIQRNYCYIQPIFYFLPCYHLDEFAKHELRRCITKSIHHLDMVAMKIS